MKTTKDLVLERIAQQIDEQTAKGAVKYNKPLEDCNLNEYDWQAMQIEELIDGSRYQHMEIMRLNKLVELYRKDAKHYAEMLDDYRKGLIK